MTLAYVGLGGNRRRTGRGVSAALRALRKIPSARLAGVSRIFISAPLDCPGRQADYRNLAARLQTRTPPRRMFRHFRRIESGAQRRPRRRNAPRILDADYLAHGRAILRGRILRLPHPRMARRAFVLAPLAQLAGRHFAGFRGAADLSRALPILLRAQEIRPAARR